MTLSVLLKDRRPLIGIVLIGLAISVMIEVLQQILVLGAFQMDDIIWNTIGALLGAGLNARRIR